jgi:hypothetical protein
MNVSARSAGLKRAQAEKGVTIISEGECSRSGSPWPSALRLQFFHSRSAIALISTSVEAQEIRISIRGDNLISPALALTKPPSEQIRCRSSAITKAIDIQSFDDCIMYQVRSLAYAGEGMRRLVHQWEAVDWYNTPSLTANPLLSKCDSELSPRRLISNHSMFCIIYHKGLAA